MNLRRPRWRRLDADFSGTPFLPQMPWYLMGPLGGLAGAGLASLLNLAAPGMIPVVQSGVVLGLAITLGEPAVVRWMGGGRLGGRGIWIHYTLAFLLFGLLLNPMGVGFLLPATTVMVAAVHVHWSGARAAPPMLVTLVVATVVNQGLLLLGVTHSLLDAGPALVAATLALLTAMVATANLGGTAARTELAGEHLGQAERRFRTLVLNSSDVVTTVDRDGCFTYLSPAVGTVLGLDPEELLGQPARLLVAPGGRPEFESRLEEVVRDSATARWEARADVEGVGWLEFSATNLLDDSSIAGVVLHFRDVTERREIGDQLAHAATHDGLTGLTSRGAFMRRADDMIGAARAEALVAVLFCDLDGFKQINDTLGHAAGDRVLVAVAQRLREALRPQDLVGRIGGDEFTVVLPDVADRAATDVVVQRITGLLAAPIELDDGRAVTVGASIGVALVGGPGVSADDAISLADQEMYQIKSGRGAVAG